MEAAFPTLAGWVFGHRDGTWTTAVYGWLALVVWLVVVAVMQSWIVVARAIHLVQQRGKRSGLRAEAAGSLIQTQ